MKSFRPITPCVAITTAVLLGGNAVAETRPTLQGLQDQLNNTYTRQQIENLVRKADPSCTDNANRYVDCGNGTVTDTATGLIWLKQANCAGSVDYAAANSLALALQSGQCGLTDGSKPGDWRLPTLKEWQDTIPSWTICRLPSLTNTVGTGCFADGPQPFSGVKTDVYWTATGNLDVPRAAWGFDLHYGLDDAVALTGQPNYVSVNKTEPHTVWPVRGVASVHVDTSIDSIRAQVVDGINLADSARANVTEYFQSSGLAPANFTQVGGSPDLSNDFFVSDMKMVNGRIDITYGKDANAAIFGKTISFTPYIDSQGFGNVVWRCGNHSSPGGVLIGTGTSGPVAAYLPTTIDNIYLPINCRP